MQGIKKYSLIYKIYISLFDKTNNIMVKNYEGNYEK